MKVNIKMTTNELVLLSQVFQFYLQHQTSESEEATLVSRMIANIGKQAVPHIKKIVLLQSNMEQN